MNGIKKVLGIPRKVIKIIRLIIKIIMFILKEYEASELKKSKRGNKEV